MLWSPAVGTALEEGEGGKLDAGGGGGEGQRSKTSRKEEGLMAHKSL